MTPAERLRAAADQLSELDWQATDGPWITEGRGGAGTYGLYHPGSDVALAEVRAWAEAALIATLRPLAPVLVKQLRAAGDRMAEECLTELDYPPDHRSGCGLEVLPLSTPPDPGRCTCFDAALALAGAILGGAA